MQQSGGHVRCSIVSPPFAHPSGFDLALEQAVVYLTLPINLHSTHQILLH
jgi:hypothetical protein